MPAKARQVAGDARGRAARAFRAPAGGALGIYAKSVNAGELKPGTGNGQVAGGIAGSGGAGLGMRRTFKLQRAAQGLLPGERVAGCQRRRKGEFVRVMRGLESGRAHYDGLETCGSVWHCPICAQRVTERRRAELQDAITAWGKRGGEVYLMTLTFPHERVDDLADLLGRQARALKRFKNSRGYKSIMREASRLGSIRALEVTWRGWHGWHPHTHDLIFATRGALPLLRQLEMLWIDAVIAEGLASRAQLNDMLEAAFDVQNGDYAAEYVAKFGFDPSLQSQALTGERWGAARELTQGINKVVRMKGKTPFGLLAAYLEGDRQAGALFAEFGRLFKGKRQLFWSPRLRAALGLGAEVDDEIIAAGADDLQVKFEQVAELDADAWRLVIAHDARGALLDWAGKAGAVGVAILLDELRRRPATHRDTGTESRAGWG